MRSLIARDIGTIESQLRYWEAIGLLPSPVRNERVYRARARVILAARRAKVPPSELKRAFARVASA